MSITYTHIINDIEVNPPENWQKDPILINFRDEQVLDQFGGDTPLVDLGTLVFVTDGGTTFPNKAANVINDYVDGGINGTNGLFEDITYKIRFDDDKTKFSGTMFDGYLLMDTYRKKSSVRVEIEARAFKDLNSLVGKIQANTFGFLEAQGLIDLNDFVDVPTVVESQDDGDLLLSLSITTALLALQFAQAIKQLATDILNISAHTVGGITGAAGGLLYLIGSAILSGIFVVILGIQILRLLIRIAVIVLPPVFQYKGILLRTLLEKAVEFLGFELDSPIPELDNVVYMPSKPSSDFDPLNSFITSLPGFPSLDSGIPRPDDFGYFIEDYFNLINRLFNAKFDSSGNDIHVKSENDPYWQNVSNFKPKAIADKDINALDQKFEEERFNIGDFKANTLISFATDPSDSWTSAYFKGTNFEVIAKLQNEKNPKLSKRGGLKKIEIPVALGNRKSQFTQVEQAAAQISDAVIIGIEQIKKFGFKVPGQFSGLIDIRERLGALRISNKVYNVPKLVVIENGKIPPDHREKLSARVLWEKYWNEISFVDNNFKGQKLLIENEPIPFTPVDFVNILDGSFYTTPEGKQARITGLRWLPDADTAIKDSWIRQVYCNKLEEQFVEPK